MGVQWNPFMAEHPVVAILSTVALLINIGLVSALFYYLASKRGYDIDMIENRLKPLLSRNYREISFVVALTATAGSLYMSNVLGWTPCNLCWFQRILMYPLVFLTGTSLVLDKEDVADYVLPLAMTGFGIAAYHAVVQRFEQFQSAGCSVTAVSCSTTYTFWYGYITISVLAATAFAAVIFLMWRFPDSE
jgi:disulfide bond formation protein DsbB